MSKTRDTRLLQNLSHTLGVLFRKYVGTHSLLLKYSLWTTEQLLALFWVQN